MMDMSRGRWAEIVRRGLLEPSEVHHAVGALSVQLGTSPTDAIARIRTYARLTGTSTSYIAEQVVDHKLRFGADGPAAPKIAPWAVPGPWDVRER